ncbi:hypothetical protein [Pontibacillus halophilus]|uniref:hypothetical protein n=1 Tax=Pontibacillus halophilus TaxID=516704 RepID=UPI0004796934|nr:hypothetical protein [Pontibacillus halophilus]
MPLLGLQLPDGTIFQTVNHYKDESMQQMLSTKKPVFYGQYQKELNCIRTLAGIEIPPLQNFGEGIHYMKAIIFCNNGLYHPIILVIDTNHGGEVIDGRLISRKHDFLVPCNHAKPFINNTYPVSYKTLEKLDDDMQQVGWPAYTPFPDNQIPKVL